MMNKLVIKVILTMVCALSLPGLASAQETGVDPPDHPWVPPIPLNFTRGDVAGDQRKVIELLHGGAIYRRDENGTTFYFTVIDMRLMEIDIVVNDVVLEVPNGGKWYQGDGNSSSNRFDKRRLDEMWDDYEGIWGGQAFAMVNGVYFETFGDHSGGDTQIALPIKDEGLFVTGGSSPLHPNDCNATDCGGFPLDIDGLNTFRIAELYNNRYCAGVGHYNEASGNPISLPSQLLSNAFVTWDPRDVAEQNTRQHQMGFIDRDGDGITEVVIDAMCNNCGVLELSQMLVNEGAAQDQIIVLDGGGSQGLIAKKAGQILTPDTDPFFEREMPVAIGFRHRYEKDFCNAADGYSAYTIQDMVIDQNSYALFSSGDNTPNGGGINMGSNVTMFSTSTLKTVTPTGVTVYSVRMTGNESISIPSGGNPIECRPFDYNPSGRTSFIENPTAAFKQPLTWEELRSMQESYEVQNQNALDFEPSTEVVIYPNPSTDNVNIYYKPVRGFVTQLKIYNTNGQEVYRKRYKVEEKVSLLDVDVDIQKFESGVYITTINSSPGDKVFSKFIKSE